MDVGMLIRVRDTAGLVDEKFRRCEPVEALCLESIYWFSFELD